ncbi:unnamed protein product [Rotaria sp. Silwood2]|nr:unnamed protein product [Rotaria sp. Silwood2]CAF3075355.1 unnamed protein product [Rotaria sp. Silwood2]CAF3159918.1 unnamed protein product [Rotaria sp. Silwood2]CAF3205673.1 unnamed protein product [Rotaria sp. Silwood2]CAF4065940.1 unnamed protein product [Rotaria sp. Silwood2]
MCWILGLIFIFYIIYRTYRHFYPTLNIDPCGKYVLISGCDSGFGYQLAIELDKDGFNVLAGVYNPTNQDSLSHQLSSRATVFSLDITKQEDIDKVFTLVQSKTNVLHALVNNAGIGKTGFIDWMSMEFLRNIMEVNFFGHVMMTKKFLPLLISKRDSRVVNVSSVAGYFAGPSMTAYASSKFALESFSDCLRREMNVWNLRVSIIEPGCMRTPIIEDIDKAMTDFWNKVPLDVKDRWGEEFWKDQLDQANANIFIQHAENPNKVVRALRHAVLNTTPHIRYRPGWQSSLVLFPLSRAPTVLIDWFLQKASPSRVLPVGLEKQIKE